MACWVLLRLMHTFHVSALQLVNKLLYRSKQRGLLELDLLVGLWAQEQVPQMSVEALEHLSVVLDQVRRCCMPSRHSSFTLLFGIGVVTACEPEGVMWQRLWLLHVNSPLESKGHADESVQHSGPSTHRWK